MEEKVRAVLARIQSICSVTLQFVIHVCHIHLIALWLNRYVCCSPIVPSIDTREAIGGTSISPANDSNLGN